jgi:hypothetical protein
MNTDRKEEFNRRERKGRREGKKMGAKKLYETFSRRSPTGMSALQLADYHTENVLPRNGSVDSAIGGVHAIVAEEEKLVFAACDEFFLDFAAGVGWGASGKIGFLKFRAIHVNCAIFEVNGVATDADDAFDGIAFGRGIANDNDVLPGWGTEMVNPTVKEVMVGIVKGREHAGADHFDGLNEVGADDVIAGQTEASDDKALE